MSTDRAHYCCDASAAATLQVAVAVCDLTRMRVEQFAKNDDDDDDVKTDKAKKKKEKKKRAKRVAADGAAPDDGQLMRDVLISAIVVDGDSVKTLARDRIASRLLEAIVARCDAKFFEQTIWPVVCLDARALALDGAGIFVLQRALQRATADGKAKT